MSTALNSIALQSLPNPTVIETPEFETILAEIKTDLLKYAPDLADVLALESEPATQIAQYLAYRILHERTWANELGLSLMLAKAVGPQLDQLGALPFIKTPRRIIRPADNTARPPTDAVMEGDEEYRHRQQLAFEGYSTAGSIGGYIYHALAAHGDVKDVAITAPRFGRWAIPSGLVNQLPAGAIVLTVTDDAGLSEPFPGDVAVSILSRSNTGVASDEVLDAVNQKLSADDVRPLTDRVHVRNVQVIEFEVSANLWFDPGPDRAVVLEAARSAVTHYVESNHRIGRDINLSGLYSALHQPGVQRVELVTPNALTISSTQAAYCTEVSLVDMGVAE